MSANRIASLDGLSAIDETVTDYIRKEQELDEEDRAKEQASQCVLAVPRRGKNLRLRKRKRGQRRRHCAGGSHSISHRTL